jgi:5'-3' exoribonuclease 2
MNQQRSRRFRSAKEAREKSESEQKIRQELIDMGRLPNNSEEEEKSHFDSNCITPGTPFMHRVAEAVRYYVAERVSSDPGWKTLSVVLSDANVPGEGEHKIMEYIRLQQAQPSYDPNQKNVIYGLVSPTALFFASLSFFLSCPFTQLSSHSPLTLTLSLVSF